MASKKYRVNSSELFNLESMLWKLEATQADMIEGNIPWDDSIEDRIEEVRDLMKETGMMVGALVDWPILKRIREIKAEREMLRYATCLSKGMSEDKAAYAFDI